MNQKNTPTARDLSKKLDQIFDTGLDDKNKTKSVPLTPMIKKIIFALLALSLLLIFLFFIQYIFFSNVTIKSVTINQLYSHNTHSKLYASPLIADLYNDGFPDYIVADMNGFIHAYSGTAGKTVYSFNTSGGIIASPTSGPFINKEGDDLLAASLLQPEEAYYTRLILIMAN
jgi:hypothetical protein